MAYKRIEAPETPLSVIEDAFRWDSKFVPSLSLIFVSHTGRIALIEGNQDDRALRLPAGTIHRPKPSKQETAIDKVRDTAAARANATFGPAAMIIADMIELAPYANRANKGIDESERQRWRNARKIVKIPAIVPTILTGDGPKKIHVIHWQTPDDTVAMLRERTSQKDAPLQTLSAFEAISLTMPQIQALIQQAKAAN